MRGHAVTGLAVLAALVVSAGSCTDNEADQPTVPARPGAYQAPGGGAPLSEDDACQRLTDAEEAARRRLACPALEHPECPYYVRPAGTGCWTYGEKSVEACEDFVQGYTACSDFSDRPCVLSATPAPELMCPPLGAGGAGAEGGGAGAGGVESGGEGGISAAGAGGEVAGAGQSGGGGEAGSAGDAGGAAGTSGGESGNAGAGGHDSASGSGGEGG